MKKLIAWILTLCVLFSLLPTAYAADDTKVQAGNEEAELLQIQVNFSGYLHSAKVLRTEDGEVLAPLEWMTYYGGLQCDELLGVRQYYKPGQEELKNYAKRWLIVPQLGKYYVNWYFDDHIFEMFLLNADDFSIGDAFRMVGASDSAKKEIMDRYFAQKNTDVKRMGTNYMPIHQGDFSKILPYADDYWVPMSELLSLLEITAAITNDGRILCMEPSQFTVFDVLYKHEEEIEDLLFDSEDVVGNDFMAGVGWVVATGTGELYNLVPGRGMEIDYKEIFTSYLQDNEVYLSAFNTENDTNVTYFRQLTETFKDTKTVFQSGIESLNPLYQILLKDATDPDFYKKFFEPAEELCLAIDVAANMMTYIAAFANQVEDHRLMLDAVYKHSAEKKWPSYVASQAISKMYASEADLAVRGTIDVTRKMLMEELSQEAYKQLYGGWYYVIEATKVICKEDYDYVVNSSKINLVSNTVKYSHEIFEDRFYDREFNEKGMNNIRLCLMMSLVGSRHAYKTYWKSGKDDDVKAVDKILTKLYQVGTSRKENNINTCKDRLKQYKEDFPKLQLTKNDPVVIAETGMLRNALGNDHWDDGKWVIADIDGDLQDEMKLYTLTPYGAIEATLDVDKNTVEIADANLLQTITLTGTVEIVPGEQMVFGDAQSLLSELDAYFAGRDGHLCSIEQDLDGDGNQDRIYAVYDAAHNWDRDPNSPLDLPIGNLSLVAAETEADGVKLRFFFDPRFNSDLSDVVYSYTDGELQVNGHAYEYKEKGSTPFEKIGIVTLQSLYSYLTGEVMPWEQARVEVSYPDDSNHRKMNLEVDGVELYVHADMEDGDVQIYEIQAEVREKPIPIIGKITTDNTAKQIIEALTLATWDSHENVPVRDNLSAVMGPYPVMSNTDMSYECSVLWSLPNGEIYQLVMTLPEENLDTSPLRLTVVSLKKPKVAVYELLLKTPDEVAAMLSGYTDDAYEGDDVIYGEGWIGDAAVEVRYEVIDGAFRAESVEVRFAEDTVVVFPGMDSTMPAEDAKDFLQPKMDWDLDHSEFISGPTLYYSTNFIFDDITNAFWYTTVISEYNWTEEEGWGQAALGGIKLSYTADKDDPSMYWYWVLTD